MFRCTVLCCSRGNSGTEEKCWVQAAVREQKSQSCRPRGSAASRSFRYAGNAGQLGANNVTGSAVCTNLLEKSEPPWLQASMMDFPFIVHLC